MLTWLADNMATILIGIALILVLALIVWHMRKDRKAGKSSCGNNCAHCAMAGKCHSGADNTKSAE